MVRLTTRVEAVGRQSTRARIFFWIQWKRILFRLSRKTGHLENKDFGNWSFGPHPQTPKVHCFLVSRQKKAKKPKLKVSLISAGCGNALFQLPQNTKKNKKKHHWWEPGQWTIVALLVLIKAMPQCILVQIVTEQTEHCALWLLRERKEKKTHDLDHLSHAALTRGNGRIDTRTEKQTGVIGRTRIVSAHRGTGLWTIECFLICHPTQRCGSSRDCGQATARLANHSKLQATQGLLNGNERGEEKKEKSLHYNYQGSLTIKHFLSYYTEVWNRSLPGSSSSRLLAVLLSILMRW